MAGISPDLGNSLWTFKLSGNKIVTTRPGTVERRPQYHPGIQKEQSMEASMEMITIPCVPFSFVSSPLNHIQTLDFKLRFPMNFERERLYKIDPFGIWICTRMAAGDNSMTPTIQPDELLLINRRFSLKSKSSIGKLFLVKIAGEITARRLIFEKGYAVLLADNHQCPPHLIRNQEELKKIVLGQILWKGGEVK